MGLGWSLKPRNHSEAIVSIPKSGHLNNSVGERGVVNEQSSEARGREKIKQTNTSRLIK